ncbi:hypothetical protein [Mycolicibacterium sp.]|uniref:hypothetical protein n=1 Tax=Mycolicibacterium sp. TaxID=2320850 RepID=UPI003D151992
MHTKFTTLVGCTAVVAAGLTATLTAGVATAAPQASPGVTLAVRPIPGDPANYIVRVQGKFPMSEGAAYDRIDNMGPGGGMDYIVYGDDPGSDDAPVGSPHGFIGAPGPPGGLVIATPDGIAFMRELRVPKVDLDEDICFSSGCDGDGDEIYVKVRFVQGTGAGDLVAYSAAVSGEF